MTFLVKRKRGCATKVVAQTEHCHQLGVLRDTPNACNEANWTCFYFITFSTGRYEHIARSCNTEG